MYTHINIRTLKLFFYFSLFNYEGSSKDKFHLTLNYDEYLLIRLEILTRFTTIFIY